MKSINQQACFTGIHFISCSFKKINSFTEVNAFFLLYIHLQLIIIAFILLIYH